MEKKKEQIEKIIEITDNIYVYCSKDCHECGLWDIGKCDDRCFIEKSAEYYYNAGLRKLDENSVVISKDEYERYNKTLNPKKVRKDGIKEVLKKLLNLDEFMLHVGEEGGMFYMDFVLWLQKVANELGVDIEEV